MLKVITSRAFAIDESGRIYFKDLICNKFDLFINSIRYNSFGSDIFNHTCVTNSMGTNNINMYNRSSKS